MGILNISIPADLKSFLDEQVSQRGHRPHSEYVCELIRKKQARLRLRGVLLAVAGTQNR
jgi:antitoxin ParD1/3/4